MRLLCLLHLPGLTHTAYRPHPAYPAYPAQPPGREPLPPA